MRSIPSSHIDSNESSARHEAVLAPYGQGLLHEDSVLSQLPDPMSWEGSLTVQPWLGNTICFDPSKHLYASVEGERRSLKDVEEAVKHHQLNASADLPAYVLFDSELRLLELISYWKQGRPHREGDRPAKTLFLFGEPYQWEWWRNGVLHRDGDKPAVVESDGEEIVRLEWWKNGLLHRSAGGPTRIEYFPGTTSVRTKMFHHRGQLHSFGDEPAIMEYTRSGRPWTKGWYCCGALHREDGPAIDTTLWPGLTRRQWWQHGCVQRGSPCHPLDLLLRLLTSLMYRNQRA